MKGIMLLGVCLVMSVLICMTEANWYGKRSDDELIRRILYNRQPQLIPTPDDAEIISKLERLLKDLKEKRNAFPENNVIFKKKK